MSHVMASFGLDHAYVRCPHYRREVRTQLPRVRPWRLFFDPIHDWKLDPEYPDETAPFGLCGWCWHWYKARNREGAAV